MKSVRENSGDDLRGRGAVLAGEQDEVNRKGRGRLGGGFC